MRAPALLAAVALLTVAPWTARNLAATGHFIPISSHAGSWLAGTYNDEARTNRAHPGAWLIPAQLAVFDDIDTSPMDETERQRALTSRALDYAADHPAYVAEVLLRNTMRLFNLEGASWWRAQGVLLSLPRWSVDAAAYAFVPLALLALAGAFMPAARRAPLWLWLVPVLMVAATIPSGSEVRYRSAIEPFLAMLAAIALVALADRLERRPARASTSLAAAAGASG